MPARRLATHAAPACRGRGAGIRPLVHAAHAGRDPDRPPCLPSRLVACDRCHGGSRSCLAPGLASRRIAAAPVRCDARRRADRGKPYRSRQPAVHRAPVSTTGSHPGNFGGDVGTRPTQGAGGGARCRPAGSGADESSQATAARRARHCRDLPAVRDSQRPLPRGGLWPFVHAVARHRLSDRHENRHGQG